MTRQEKIAKYRQAQPLEYLKKKAKKSCRRSRIRTQEQVDAYMAWHEEMTRLFKDNKFKYLHTTEC